MATSQPIKYISGHTGKVAFFTEAHARETLRKFKKTKGGNPIVYHCNKKTELSDHWHISSKGKGKRYEGAC